MKIFAPALMITMLLATIPACAAKPSPTQQSKSNIIYLHQAITKGDAQSTFNNIIKNGNVVVDFYADWCGPCKSAGSYIERVASQYPNVTFLKVNTDTYPGISRAYAIKSMPTFLFYKNGNQFDRFVGFHSSKLAEQLNNY